MSKNQKTELYLKVPYHILNISGLSPAEKFLLAHIYSFGEKGCWQSNETLGKMFFVSSRSVSNWVAILKKAGLILWVHPKGRYRTIWAKTHPQVKTANTLLYMRQKISKEAVISGKAEKILLGRNLPGGIEENFAATAKNNCIQVGRNLLHTNNTTKKDTIEETIATPSPPPCKGAPALLAEREKQADAVINHFLRNFGKEKKTWQPLSPEEFEARRAAQIRALIGIKNGEFRIEK
jgi:hypothetical protein